MPASKLDSIYRRLLITRFFEKGWGNPENLQRLFQFRKIISDRKSCYKLIPRDYPVQIVKEEKFPDCKILEGNFISPLVYHLPGIVPTACKEAHFQVVLPNEWKQEKYKPICIHLAGTGDHFFWRRRNFVAKPLLKEANIAAIILENPFYGLRKPDNQVRSNLHNVSDIFVMGGCLILECLVLLHWCERNGFGPLGITGLSMGGHMASLAATNWPKPIALVPCLSWTTASAVFTTGVMSQSINWQMLQREYFSDGKYSQRLSKMVTIIDEAFTAGQNFIKNFDQSIIELKEDIKDAKLFQQLTPISQKNIDMNFSAYIENSNKPIEIKSNFKEYASDNENITNKPIKTFNISTPNLNSSALTNLMKHLLPKKSDNDNEKIDTTKPNWCEKEVLQFMRGIMDECTHLMNFSVPFDTSLIIAVCAKADAYVPREGCSSLEDIWPGADIRYVNSGHVSAYVLHQKLFRSCIIESFERAKKVYGLSSDKLGEDIVPTLTYKDLINK